MFIITSQELLLVVPSIAILANYHLYLFIRVRRCPLRTAIEITNHASFMINTHSNNDPAISTDTVTQVLNHGELHYTLGMRGYYLSIPLALWLFGPFWMMLSCLVLVTVLYRLDREA